MNLWSGFKQLFARDQTIITVTVQAVNADGTSIVTASGMQPFKVIGTSVTAGGLALIQQGRIIGQGSDLPTYSVTG